MLSVVLLKFVDLFVTIFTVLIFARVILSWVVRDAQSNGLVRLVHELTEPILDPLRKVLPSGGGLDLSPIVAYFLLQGLGYLAQSLLLGR